MKKKRILIITGPTAVGKSDLAYRLAQTIPVEIINADVGQMYQPLTIGTAKPDWKSSSILHHGFDILEQPEQYSVAAYRKYVESVCTDIWKRNKMPLIVGGSLFYIQSLFFPPVEQKIPEQPLLSLPEDQNWQALYAYDPERARAIHPHDTYRIKRAFALLSMSGGARPSQYAPPFQPLAHALIFWITRHKEQLYTRINERVVTMFRQGFLQEVQGLRMSAWEPFLYTKKLIGYDDCLRFLQEISPSQEGLISTIQQKTRHYAKRQYTFWRMFEAKLATNCNPQYNITTSTYDLTIGNDDLYSSSLISQVNQFENEKYDHAAQSLRS